MIQHELDSEPNHGSSARGSLRSGTVLQNRYRILDVLGVGGMSTVYCARDLRFTSVDRLCAVKEMFNTTDDPKLRQIHYANFQREAALLATLTHAAIPRIFDYFEHQGSIYLILELIRGQDIETMLTKRGAPFDEQTLIGWTIRLCDVLAYLHGQQPEPIVFRDLKPSNLMVRLEDQSLMLVDFGIARSFAPQQRGTMIGTEGYAPPEQYKGISDIRGDVYALGATLHHLATGSDPRMETPFTFDERPLRKLNSNISTDFQEIVMRCLAYEPSERFASVTDVKDAFEMLQRNGFAIDLDVPVAQTHPHHASPIASIAAPPIAQTQTRANDVDWVCKTGDEVRGTASAANGTVFVGSYDRRLYAIDEDNGTINWTFKAQRGIVSRPAVSEELVIFGSEDGNVYAISCMTGRVVWTFRTNLPVRSSPSIHDNLCAIGSDDGFLYCLDVRGGVVLWRYKTWGPIRSSAATTRGSVVVGSDDGHVYCIGAGSGQLKWRAHVGAPVTSSPAIFENFVVFGAADGTIRAVGLDDGRPHWRQSASRAVIASPVVQDQAVLLGSADGFLYALSVFTGEIQWKTHLDGQITSSAAIDGPQVYVGINNGAVCCLNWANGEMIWRHNVGGAVVARPLITPRHIIFGSLDGSVYALHRNHQ